jgi:hypothetical protein
VNIEEERSGLGATGVYCSPKSVVVAAMNRLSGVTFGALLFWPVCVNILSAELGDNQPRLFAGEPFEFLGGFFREFVGVGVEDGDELGKGFVGSERAIRDWKAPSVRGRNDNWELAFLNDDQGIVIQKD